MPGRSRSVGIGIATFALGVTLGASPASAQTQEELDRARVEFRQGVALMAANNCAAALAKFQEVARVKRTPQVLFNIGECEERVGKLVSSLGNYRLAAAAAEGDKKAQDVTNRVGDRIAALEERIPKLNVRRGTGAETAAIYLDGVEIGQSESTAEIPVDPGTHVVAARVGDKEAFRETVSMEERSAKTVDVTIEVPEPEPAAVEPEPVKPPPPPPPPKGSKVPGIVVLSAGVASTVVGAVFLGLRGGALSDLDKVCNSDNACPPSAESTADSGRLYTGLAQVTLPLGVVGIAAGIVMLVTSGKGGDAAPSEETTSGEASSEARRRGPRRAAYSTWSPSLVPAASGANVGGLSVRMQF
ncbi:hypothetical protein [Chondromyces crocatus]|uniref:PEGA domain-containing protein n=1 Tax=Chondromyces crocatus TaxID=52 RepID=A0A0K1EGR3_CHOCO|nr:hypothetical protein [Chondromyces crocatus]AKT39877.1 uncharacterized protein CMC5_040280 [Chondromyces crocatus]